MDGKNKVQNRSTILLKFQQFLHSGWKAILILILIELVLVYKVNGYRLHDGLVQQFIEFTQVLAPNIGKVNAHDGESTGAIRLYMSLSFYIFLLKILVFYFWLNRGDDHHAQLVVSPETTVHEGTVGDYIQAPLKEQVDTKAKKSRSMLNRIVWSILIVAFSLTAIWFFLFAGDPEYERNASKFKYFSSLSFGGLSLWITWSMQWLTFTAFLTAIAIHTVKGYGLFFKRNK